MKRKKPDDKLKAKVALEAIKGEMTTAEIISKYQVHANQITRWKKELIENASGVFSKKKDPQIFNTDQGSQFTDKRFLKILEEKKIEISMDGKGRALDNVFIERLWRTVKYEDIYLRRYESVKECREGLKKYFDFYNYRRKHQSHNYNTPAEIYQTQNGINLTEKQA